MSMIDDMPVVALNPPQTALGRISRRIARLEMVLGAVLVAAVFGLLLLNAATRFARIPILWVDELAVQLMVCLAFVGASIGVAARNHMAITLLPEKLSPRGRIWLSISNNILVLLFLCMMAWLIWRWLDPIGLIRAGSGQALAAESFNFVYTTPTLTIGINKIWFWLIIPLTTLTLILHVFAALAEDIAGLKRS